MKNFDNSFHKSTYGRFVPPNECPVDTKATNGKNLTLNRIIFHG